MRRQSPNSNLLHWPSRRFNGRCLIATAAVILCIGLFQDQAAGQQTKKEAEQSAPRDYASRNFLVHTDLEPDEAKELLKRLETMLGDVSAYFGRRPSGVIECYVVKDLSKWPDGALHPEGRAKIEEGAGITLSLTVSQGNQFIAKSVVFAVADRGTPQHEAVHAYCAQTFGTTGPVWFAEGMAEMGQYWVEGDPSINARQEVIDYLKSSEPKSLTDIVSPFQFTGDSWQNYAWRWALCHLLANNPNYAPRFKPLGLALLAKQEITFEQVYGPMAQEITFEYLFFLKHMDQGYRVDLCAWDWKKAFKPLTTSGRTVSTYILANRGWQPSGLTVQKGDTYEFTATGTWKTAKDAEGVSADGDDEGRGRLVGVLMKDFELSEPFELSSAGEFTAENDGDLYLRCEDAWNELADNSGRVSVRLKYKKPETN